MFWISHTGTYFCLKYNKPLRRTAIPEEARTGSRSHPIVFDKYWFMLSMLKSRQNDGMYLTERC